MGLFKKKQVSKFCPVCGSQLKLDDGYCMRCGYSFAARHKKTRKRIKWKNLIIALIILAIIYFGIRYYLGHPVIPISLQDAINFTK